MEITVYACYKVIIPHLGICGLLFSMALTFLTAKLCRIGNLPAEQPSHSRKRDTPLNESVIGTRRRHPTCEGCPDSVVPYSLYAKLVTGLAVVIKMCATSKIAGDFLQSLL